jgi:coenzyme F420-reducing hydrogenase beta subunit
LNITEQLRNQASQRWIIIAIAAAVADLLCGWAIAPALLLFILILTPMIAGLLAYFAARTYVWAALGVNEEYAKSAYERQQQMERKELRETLDTIGREALDEVEAAIERRDEGKSDV